MRAYDARADDFGVRPDPFAILAGDGKAFKGIGFGWLDSGAMEFLADHQSAADVFEFRDCLVALDPERAIQRAGDFDIFGVLIRKRPASETFPDIAFVFRVDVLCISDIDGNGHAGVG